MALLKLELGGWRGGEVVINSDDISSMRIQCGYSYTDYLVTMKEGTTYSVSAKSYEKIKALAE